MATGTGEEEFVFEFYKYTPSLPAAILFTIIFFLLLCHHVYIILRTRTWYFIPLTVGVILETLGYAMRIASHYDKEAMGPYVMQSTFIVVAPALFAASIYMILGRLIRHLGGEEYSVIPLRWLTKIFVAGDVLSFLMQGSGSGIMASGDHSSLKTGEKVVIGGIFVQVFIFGIFLIVMSVFHMRISRHPTQQSIELSTVHPKRYNWNTLLMVIYVSGGLIMFRSIFRAIEFIMGWDGPLLEKEVWIYLFDALLMAGAVGVFNWCHPAFIVPGNRKRVVSQVESEAEEGIMMRNN